MITKFDTMCNSCKNYPRNAFTSIAKISIQVQIIQFDLNSNLDSDLDSDLNPDLDLSISISIDILSIGQFILITVLHLLLRYLIDLVPIGFANPLLLV